MEIMVLRWYQIPQTFNFVDTLIAWRITDSHHQWEIFTRR